jgi:hypothetical protein
MKYHFPSLRLLVVLIALLLSGAAFALFQQSPVRTRNTNVIELGIPLVLGLQQQDVLEQLKKISQYKLIKVAGGDAWIVRSGDNAVASLSFHDGKLTEVSRSWGPENQQSGVPFAKGLFGVANQFVKEGRTNCVLQTNASEYPGSESRGVSIICNGKYIEVNVTEVVDGDAKGSYATVEETMR